MKKRIEVISAHMHINATLHAIATLKGKGFSAKNQNFIVVPQTQVKHFESNLLEMVGEESILSTRVVSFATLCDLIQNEEMTTCKILSKVEQTIAMLKVLKGCKNELKFFSNATISVSFAQKMLEIVEFLNENCFNFNKFEKMSDKDDLFFKKMVDFSQVSNLFMKEIGDESKTDWQKIIDATAIIESCEIVKNSNFIFCNHRILTNTQTNFICEIAKHSKSAILATATESNSKTEKTSLDDVIEILNQSVEITSQNATDDFSELGNHIFNYAFSNNPTKMKEGVEVCGFTSKFEECEYAAKKIKNILFNNPNKKIAVALCDHNEFCEPMKTVLEKFSIGSFFAESKPLESSSIIFVIQNFCKSSFSKNSAFELLKVVKNEFFKNEFLETFENHVLKWGCDSKFLINEFLQASAKGEQEKIEKTRKSLMPVFLLLSNFEKCETISEKTNCVQEFLKIIKKNCANETKSNNNERKMNEICAAEEILKNIQGETVVSTKEFCLLISMASKTKFLKNKSRKNGEVFIGDASKSSFPKTDELFVVGANEGLFPIFQKEKTLLFDEEIEKLLPKKFTAKALSKIEREKMNELVCMVGEKIHISFQKFNDEGKELFESGFASSIAKCFESSNKHLLEGETKNELAKFLQTKKASNSLLLMLANKETSFKECKKIGGVFQNLANNFDDETQLGKNIKEKQPLSAVARKTFFPQQKFSVSQLNCFFSCPLKHYFSYGLRLKERENIKMKANVIGDIFHEVARFFFTENATKIQSITNEQISNFANAHFEMLKNDERFKQYFDAKENNFALSIAKKQLPKSLVAIASLQKQSNFVPTDFEKTLSADENEQKLVFSGKMDRIDKNGNHIVIVDYKTSSKNSIAKQTSLKSIFNGTYLQLIMYANLASTKLGKKIGATMIMPFAFLETTGELEKCSGLFSNDKNVAEKLDSTIFENQKSKFFPYDLTKDGNFKKKTNILSDESFNVLFEYVNILTSKALKQILMGEKRCLPAENACEFCQFKEVCNFNATQTEQRKTDAMKIEDFVAAIQKEKEKNNGIIN